ncbi:YncE family protein [Saccharicrinis sp. FJH54]|uniref:YncE family protein n=1 Tax=Saccharicrinis sp. FJH54 TaxID=3344665 RepID=UPI0035D3EB86
MKKLFHLLLIVLVSGLVACETENPQPEEIIGLGSGVFVLNEGNFGANNASLSFYSKDSMNLTNNVFQSLTGKELGNVLQSMSIINGKAYLVMNASQKIEILDLNTFENSRITDLSYPRYMIQAGTNKAYISNGNGYNQDYIYVLNTTTNSLTDSIAISTGPETFLKDGSDVYVACKGGYLTDSTLYVINSETDKITDTIAVGEVPVEMVKDASGSIWVLCNGRIVYASDWKTVIKTIPGCLKKINPLTKHVEQTITFASPVAGFGTNNLAINKEGTTLYINNGDIKAYDIENDLMSPLILNANWYGIDVDPQTGNIWGTLFSGKVQVYNTEGNRLAEYTAGVSPNGVVFFN